MLLSAIRTVFGRGHRGVRPARLAGFRPRLEFLEERAVPSRTITVDDDRAQDKNADFTSIQAAVNAAMPGDRIRVFAGTYKEQVVIPAADNNLDLSAVGPNVVIQSPATFTDPTEAVVHVDGAKGVDIRGFAITGNKSSTNGPNFGVLVDGGGSADITGNRVTAIRDNPLSGAQDGVGISFGLNSTAGASEAGTGSAVGNLVTDYQKDGIEVIGTGSRATVAFNVVRGAGPTGVIAQNGIQVSDGATADVNANVVSGNKFTGSSAEGVAILVFQTSKVSVRNNFVFGNDEGILLFADDPALAVTGSTVSGNTSFNNTFNGVGLFNANNNTVSGNNTSFNGFDGINLEQSSGDKVSNNEADFNGRDGIALESTATGNTVANNRARRNVVDDLFDGSKGTGTAGTANTWAGNRAATTDPVGLAARPGRGKHNDGDGHDGDRGD